MIKFLLGTFIEISESNHTFLVSSDTIEPFKRNNGACRYPNTRTGDVSV